MKANALFFSRGRGWGHAVPDIAIIRELSRIAPDLTVTVACYATGADAFRRNGFKPLDLELPEIPSFLAAQQKCHEIIKKTRPDIVYSHEEFGALSAARLAETPTIFMSTWLPGGGTIAAESLASVDAVIVLEHPGIFAPPPSLMVQPYFVGPVVREMTYSRGDRPRARQELGIAETVTLISVLTGSYASETKAPILPTVVGAYELMDREKNLVWVAGKERDDIAARTQNVPGIRVIEYADPVEQLLVASDVVVTKATQGVTLEAGVLGTPTISLSNGSNPVDDTLVARTTSNIALSVKATDSFTLAAYIECALAHPDEFRLRSGRTNPGSAREAAKILVSETSRLTAHATDK